MDEYVILFYVSDTKYCNEYDVSHLPQGLTEDS